MTVDVDPVTGYHLFSSLGSSLIYARPPWHEEHAGCSSFAHSLDPQPSRSRRMSDVRFASTVIGNLGEPRRHRVMTSRGKAAVYNWNMAVFIAAKQTCYLSPCAPSSEPCCEHRYAYTGAW
ncbi:hypothetical protein AcW1_002897 [Taiwanofungus camphoratus]|nr:hypothetical protein AcW1_002897 [Antrodia cinnamomea]